MTDVQLKENISLSFSFPEIISKVCIFILSTFIPAERVR